MSKGLDTLNNQRPTEEQIRHFWMSFGFEFGQRKESPRFGGPPQEYWALYDHWKYPDGTLHHDPPQVRNRYPSPMGSSQNILLECWKKLEVIR